MTALRDCLHTTVLCSEVSDMLPPLCSIRWGYSNDCHSKSNTPHAHYECTQYQNITLAGSYWRATDDPHVTNRTLLSIVKVLFYITYIDLQKQNGKRVRISNIQRTHSKRPRNFCFTPPQRTVSTTWESVPLRWQDFRGALATERTFVWERAMLKTKLGWEMCVWMRAVKRFYAMTTDCFSTAHLTLQLRSLNKSDL